MAPGRERAAGISGNGGSWRGIPRWSRQPDRTSRAVYGMGDSGPALAPKIDGRFLGGGGGSIWNYPCSPPGAGCCQLGASWWRRRRCRCCYPATRGVSGWRTGLSRHREVVVEALLAVGPDLALQSRQAEGVVRIRGEVCRARVVGLKGRLFLLDECWAQSCYVCASATAVTLMSSVEKGGDAKTLTDLRRGGRVGGLLRGEGARWWPRQRSILRTGLDWTGRD